MISTTERRAIARRAELISLQLHTDAIGSGAWYRDWIGALDRNIAWLKAIGKRRRWQIREHPIR